jgi:hypothetical protein
LHSRSPSILFARRSVRPCDGSAPEGEWRRIFGPVEHEKKIELKDPSVRVM